ncbi:MAG: glucose 1-dehydrogenase [Abditibacteriales bacterium]|nr:glucose 1-dehydrogenase [Abditibacteriales bacterium]MDW8366561.1 glucose 1-dehydrogenase [Abditibacteriales bacterium]
MDAFLDLTDQVAVVTGSSRGIGRAIAEELARVGARVVVTSRRLEAAQNVADSLPNAVALQVDVADRASVDALVNSVLERCGRVDVLVNNAGISPMYTRALKINESDWDAVMATNLKGTFLCCQAFGRVFVEQRRGCIVNISSVAAHVGAPRLAAYAASKAGIEALTRTLAIEWAEFGVRVNAVAPAFIETDMNAGLRQIPSLTQEVLDKTPLRFFGQPADVAGILVFLCSEKARYITGATFAVDGGWLAQ